VLDGALSLGPLNNGADTGTRLRSWLWSGEVRVDRDRDERDRNTAELRTSEQGNKRNKVTCAADTPLHGES
jgi:hypothetical protein